MKRLIRDSKLLNRKQNSENLPISQLYRISLPRYFRRIQESNKSCDLIFGVSRKLLELKCEMCFKF